MSLGLFLLLACLAPLAFLYHSPLSFWQALASFVLCWGVAAAWWRKKRDQIRESSLDGETGLLGQAVFTARLRHEMARAKRFGQAGSLLVLEADAGENLDQRHGEGAEQAVLKELANCLKYGVRSVDTSGRWDEKRFCVIFPSTDLKAAKLAAAKVLKSVSKLRVKLPDGSKMGGVSVALGLAEFNAKAETVVNLVERACQAAEEARKKGRNRIEIAG